MNKDQLKGKAKNLGGKIQEKAGELTGSSRQQAEGLKNQVKGKTQEKLGDVEDALGNPQRGNRQ
ncbi:MAG TPA: CsbD family protein [Telluria sp.]|nr:CsbD family protein [Telluria sp.]